MGVETRSSTVETADGKMPVHIARPKDEGKLPAVILIMEAFGLNGHIREVAARLAGEGYHVVAPDVYYRSGSNTVVGYDDLPKAIELMKALGDEQVIRDLESVIASLSSDPGVDESRIGITGFCMGGRISYLAACEIPAIRAAVPFYGGGIAGPQFDPETTPPAERTAKMRAPILLHFGEKDAFIPLETVDLVRAALAGAKKDFELHVYEGADHGFYCDERPSYHEASAKLAWSRTIEFFTRHLRA